MMDHLIKIAAIVFTVPFLLACKDKHSYSYLIQHPLELKTAFDRCQEMETKTPEDVAQCETVMKAASNVAGVIDKMQSDPQSFGQAIMSEQTNAAKLSAQIADEKNTLENLKIAKAPANDIVSAQNKLQQLQQQYDAKLEEIGVMLGVIGMNSPE